MGDWEKENREKIDNLLKRIPTMTEKDYRTLPFNDIPYPTSEKDLMRLIGALRKLNNNDYGIAVEVMAMASILTFHYMSHIVGASGFQASCAGLEFIRMERWMKHGFRIIDYEDLLYPQHLGDFPTLETLLAMPEIKVAAQEKIDEAKMSGSNIHPEVYMHWCKLAGVKVNPKVKENWDNWMKLIQAQSTKEAQDWGKVIK